MYRLNSKGFALVETIVVSLFLMVIFGIIYSNFIPLIGEYEKREFYDDIDSKYAVFLLKSLIEDADYKPNNINFSNGNYIRFECKDFSNDDKKALCKNIVKQLEVHGSDVNGNNSNVFIMKYNITEFKTKIAQDSSVSSSLIDYIEYLPNYNKESLNNAKYRVIARFHHTKNGNDYYSYGTIEVDK